MAVVGIVSNIWVMDWLLGMAQCTQANHFAAFQLLFSTRVEERFYHTDSLCTYQGINIENHSVDWIV